MTLRFVYAFRCGNFIKLGLSGCPEVRISKLCGKYADAQRPEELWEDSQTGVLLVYRPGTHVDERFIHRALRKYRASRGEWFSKCITRTKVYQDFFSVEGAVKL